MAIKIIKFDLPINGTKVTTLEALRDNLTDEIVKLARSGQLERWFKSRQLHELAQAVAAAVASPAEDKALFMALCAVLEVEVHPDDASAIFDMPPEAGRHVKDGKNFESYEDLKKTHEQMRQAAKKRILDLESSIRKTIGEKKDLKTFSYYAGASASFPDKDFRIHLENILKKSIEI